MNIESQVLGFIKRRFPEDSHWTDGNCYWFAFILANRFRLYNPVMMYNATVNHFVIQIDGRYYDHDGLYDPGEDELWTWEQYCTEDPIASGRVVYDCVM